VTSARVLRRVTRVTQSPMNPAIWFLDLECGHEARVVQKARPSMESIKTAADGEKLCGPRRVRCPKC
jgi:hypothetical protein